LFDWFKSQGCVSKERPSSFWGPLFITKRRALVRGKIVTVTVRRRIKPCESTTTLEEVCADYLSLISSMKRQVELNQTAFVPAPPLFVGNSRARIITTAPSRTAGRSLVQGFNWQQDSYNNVFFLDDYNPGVIQLFVKELAPETQDCIRFTGEAALGIVRQFEDFGKDAVKLHWIFTTYTCLQSKSWETTFNLSGTYLIKLLGWDARKDLSKAKKLNRIDHCLNLLRTLDATIK